MSSEQYKFNKINISPAADKMMLPKSPIKFRIFQGNLHENKSIFALSVLIDSKNQEFHLYVSMFFKSYS